MAKNDLDKMKAHERLGVTHFFGVGEGVSPDAPSFQLLIDLYEHPKSFSFTTLVILLVIKHTVG